MSAACPSGWRAVPPQYRNAGEWVPERARNERARLEGKRTRSSARHGKHLFIVFELEALVMHFGTNGSLGPVRRDATEPAYARLRLDFADGGGLAYVNPRRLGGVGLCQSVEEFVGRSGLGPDVLDEAFCRAGSEQAVERLPKDFLLPHRGRGGHCPRCGNRGASRPGQVGGATPISAVVAVEFSASVPISAATPDAKRLLTLHSRHCTPVELSKGAGRTNTM